MRDRHVARARVQLAHAGVQRYPQRVRVVGDLRVREEMAHLRGVEERDEPEADRAVLVVQVHVGDAPVVDAGEVDALACEKVCRVGHALCRVVVARHAQDGQAARGRLGEQPVHARHGLVARRCLVVDVPGDKQCVHLARAGYVERLRQDVALVI